MFIGIVRVTGTVVGEVVVQPLLVALLVGPMVEMVGVFMVVMALEKILGITFLSISICPLDQGGRFVAVLPTLATTMVVGEGG